MRFIFKKFNFGKNEFGMQKIFLQTLLLIGLISCSKEVLQQNLQVSSIPSNGGTISPSSNAYEKGSVLSLLATPSGEFTFKQWQGSLSGSTNPISLTMDSDKQVTGIFEKRQYPLSITIEGSGSVKEEVLSISSQSQYPAGTTVRLTGIPQEGWNFSDWSGDKSSGSNPFDISVNTPINLKVTFLQNYSLQEFQIDHPEKLNIFMGMSGTPNSNILFKSGTEAHIMAVPAIGRTDKELKLPVLYLSKGNGGWSLQNKFENINMSFGGRDVHTYGKTGFVWADHGTEVWLGGGTGTPPYNNVWVADNFTTSGASWTKVNKDRSFYHGVSSGDLNYDGLVDIVAVHMSTSSQDLKDAGTYHVFLKQADGTFKINYSTLNYPGAPNPGYMCWNSNTDGSGCPGVIRASVLIEDVTGDGNPEIIGGAYVHKPEWKVPIGAQNSLEVWSDPNRDGKYELIKHQNRMGWWNYDFMGASQIKADDVDKDGDKDLIVNFEGSKGSTYVNSADFNGVQIFKNNGKGEFEYSGIEIPFDDIRLAEFELWDVDQDGDKDIVFNVAAFIDLGSTNGLEKAFFYSGKNRFIKDLVSFDENYYSANLNFDELIYYNEGGQFVKKNKGFQIRLNKAIPKRANFKDSDIFNAGIQTINSAMIDNKLVFFGFVNDLNMNFANTANPAKYVFKVLEYSPKF